GVAGGEGRRVQPVEERLEVLADLLGAGALVAEGAVALPYAVLGEGGEGRVEARRLFDVQLARRQGGVHRAVQDQPARPVRVEPGVGGAQERPVRGTDVVELLVAQRGPDDVNVPGRFQRGHVTQQLRRVRPA